MFVNGWNAGPYVGDVGPQTTFNIPSGFLNDNGTNEVAIALTSVADSKGGKGAAGSPVSMTVDADRPALAGGTIAGYSVGWGDGSCVGSWVPGNAQARTPRKMLR